MGYCVNQYISYNSDFIIYGLTLGFIGGSFISWLVFTDREVKLCLKNTLRLRR